MVLVVMPLKPVILLISLMLCAVSSAAQERPAEAPRFDTLTVQWENDFYADTDWDYTNGIKLTWSSPVVSREEEAWTDAVENLFAILPLLGDDGFSRALSLSVGQAAYTPANTGRADLITTDRPYVGRLYVATGLHSRDAGRKSTWEAHLGVVGPISFAEDTQALVHRVVGANDAKGWDHQLKNEVTLDLVHETQWRRRFYPRSTGFSLDLIPHLGGSIGTAQTYVNTGLEVRMGWRLPDDFGNCSIRAGCTSNSAFKEGRTPVPGVQLFVSANGKAVLHNIFLDGNTFRSSHSVTPEVFVGEIMGGVAWQAGPAKVTWAYIQQSRTFTTQDRNHGFGSISISWIY